jgi:hypothetical protein
MQLCGDDYLRTDAAELNPGEVLGSRTHIVIINHSRAPNRAEVHIQDMPHRLQQVECNTAKTCKELTSKALVHTYLI